MNFQEQQELFRSHWPAMQGAAESTGAQGVIDFVAGFTDPAERRVLFAFARRGLVHEEWQGRTLDAYVEVARAGIRECLLQAKTEDDSEESKKRINTANVISYNLSADLADCWDDAHERTREHFEAGLVAAEDCIRWREELGNPPHTKSIAWWAKGMHQLSLGNAEGASDSFQKSTDFSLEASDNDEASFGVVLGRGYEAIASKSDSRYRDAVGVFRAQLEDSEKKDDAQFGIDQLERVHTRYGG